jgi:hypothetical protein
MLKTQLYADPPVDDSNPYSNWPVATAGPQNSFDHPILSVVLSTNVVRIVMLPL